MIPTQPATEKIKAIVKARGIKDILAISESIEIPHELSYWGMGASLFVVTILTEKAGADFWRDVITAIRSN